MTPVVISAIHVSRSWDFERPHRLPDIHPIVHLGVMRRRADAHNLRVMTILVDDGLGQAPLRSWTAEESFDCASSEASVGA